MKPGSDYDTAINRAINDVMDVHQRAHETVEKLQQAYAHLTIRYGVARLEIHERKRQNDVAQSKSFFCNCFLNLLLDNFAKNFQKFMETIFLYNTYGIIYWLNLAHEYDYGCIQNKTFLGVPEKNKVFMNILQFPFSGWTLMKC